MRRFGILTGTIVSLALLLGSCDFFTPKTPVVNSAVVTSVSPDGLNKSLQRTLDAPHIEYRYSDSSAPDYLKVTLTGISVVIGSAPTPIWTGSMELTLSGDGAVDLGTGIALTNLPAGKIDAIRLDFLSAAKIKGTHVGDYEDPADSSASVTKTFYTKAAYVFDPSGHVNVGETTATPYSAFETAPAEESTVYLGGGPDDNAGFSIDTASSFTIDPLSDTTLTILVDLSRMLRFEDGRKPGGETYAHFFSNSVFSASVAAFFGTVGSIQGYETLYSTLDYHDTVTDDHVTTNVKEVPGWMTVAFDADGNFLSGMTIGDDDNALTISKGTMTDWTANPTDGFDFTLGVSHTTVTGFVPVVSGVLGTVAADVTFVSPHGGNEIISGDARFTLAFQTP